LTTAGHQSSAITRQKITIRHYVYGSFTVPAAGGSALTATLTTDSPPQVLNINFLNYINNFINLKIGPFGKFGHLKNRAFEKLNN
jgi:hypothetical protein